MLHCGTMHRKIILKLMGLYSRRMISARKRRKKNINQTGKGKTVVVGMSGGVDSSVAAWLLKQQGYHVIGVTMQIWQEEPEELQQENGGCCGLQAVEDARQVAEKLSIPYYVINFRQVFKKQVMDYFAEEYCRGRTPNPCIACNRYVKWEALLSRSLELGADFIATGHYAKVKKRSNGRYTLGVSASADKDQTYALYRLTQKQLSRTLMPLGDYSKDEVRRIAEDIGLSVAKKPDSQEICFIPDHRYAEFIQQYTKKEIPSGNFVDGEGRILGRHKGITHYTIGQRRGLGLAAGRRIFVKEIRPESNEVVIGEGDEVFSSVLICNQINWMGFCGLDEREAEVTAKIRYSHNGEQCIIRQTGEDIVECKFLHPVRAATPGQAVVFYSDNFVAGGGTIC